MGRQKGKYFLGVDLGGTNIQAGVLDANHRLLARVKTKTKAEEGPPAVIRRVAAAARNAASDAGLDMDEIGGLGIGAPGVVDVDRGIVLKAVNLRWDDLPLAKSLRREVGVPVVVDNDVNVAAWGEYVAGVGGGFPDMLGVWVGTGIGGGLILGGRLYRGFYQTSGEIGHTVLHADAPLGRRTLENIASRTAIVNTITQLINSNHQSKITNIAGEDLSSIRSRVIAKAYNSGDRLTRDVVGQAARDVGVAIANCVTLLSLPCVVVGGGFTDALGQKWVDLVRKSFETHVFPPQLACCKVLASKLGDDAGIIGAALLCQDVIQNKQRVQKK
jgi:glucokinase